MPRKCREARPSQPGDRGIASYLCCTPQTPWLLSVPRVGPGCIQSISTLCCHWSQMALFSHSLHFPTEKGGEDQLSLSSICPGNYCKAPAEREALPLVCNDAQHPGSRQKGALLLPKCARPCPGMPAGMPASAHLNGKKRDENPGGRQKQSERSPSDKRQQNINLVTKKRRNYSDHRTVTH